MVRDKFHPILRSTELFLVDPPTLSLLLEINQELKNNSQEEENKYKVQRERHRSKLRQLLLDADRAKRQSKLMLLGLEISEGLDDLLSDIRDEEPAKKPEDFPIIDQAVDELDSEEKSQEEMDDEFDTEFEQFTKNKEEMMRDLTARQKASSWRRSLEDSLRV